MIYIKFKLVKIIKKKKKKKRERGKLGYKIELNY